MTNAQNEHLERLIAQIGKGDRAAFDALYDMTSADLHALCVTILNDRPAAETTLQDVYVAVWKQARNFTDFGLQPMTWLVSMTRTRAIARLRALAPNANANEAKSAIQFTVRPADTTQPDGEQLPKSGPLATLEEERLTNLRDAYLYGATYENLAKRGGLSVKDARQDMKAALLGLDAKADTKLSSTQLDQFLAAELVLGLLDDETTEAAFDRKSDDLAFAELVRGWQEYLMPLSTGLTPIMAPARARQRTRETLGLVAAPLTVDPTEKTPWYRGPIGVVALLLVVAVAVLIYLWQMDAG